MKIRYVGAAMIQPAAAGAALGGMRNAGARPRASPEFRAHRTIHKPDIPSQNQLAYPCNVGWCMFLTGLALSSAHTDEDDPTKRGREMENPFLTALITVIF
jgi:hypothetical protein